MEPWAARVRHILDSAETVYVIANNHFEAKALVNAIQLGALIFGVRVRAPEILITNYPKLKDVTVEEELTASHEQAELFPRREKLN